MTRNSYSVKWGHINDAGEIADVGVPASTTVNCTSVLSYHGTGPWKYNGATSRADGSISSLSFMRNDDWWVEHGNAREVRDVNYNTRAEMRSGLLNGILHIGSNSAAEAGIPDKPPSLTQPLLVRVCTTRPS